MTATPLLAPRDGVPDVIESARALDEYVQRLANGHGPIALDAERASGFTYSQRAYLIQLRSAEAGTALIDPIAISDFTGLQSVITGREWVLHAASQDLPCLAELGLVPQSLFDTELAARLLGRPRVGLGPLVESELALVLEKGHGAADWSKRPLPEAWLRYAALDVELLIDLRRLLGDELERAGKSEWAMQEFEYVRRSATERPVRADPWRRTSGIHKVRRPRNLAIVREMWLARDHLAQRRDISPGRILTDAAIVEVAVTPPATQAALVELPGYRGPKQRKHAEYWWQAIQRALDLDESEWPPAAIPGDGPPAAKTWADRNPAAAARLAQMKAALAELSEQIAVPVENLMQPALVRQVCWEPPKDLPGALEAGGARAWQCDLVIPLMVEAFTAAPAVVTHE